jgi:indolepyruvate ferredoxin oxidoreductase
MEFVKGKREILVVEEKRGIIESQFKEYFYDYPGSKPERMVGKHDETGARLISLDRRIVAADAGRRAGAAARSDVSPNCSSPVASPRSCPSRTRMIAVPGRCAHAVFLLGLPAQHVDESARRLDGAGWHRLPFHGELDGPRDLVADPDGRRRRQLGSVVEIHPAIRMCSRNLGEGTYYHFRLDGDPPGDRGEDQHHLQDLVSTTQSP